MSTERDPFAFFDAIYCINLDSRPNRWAEVQRELAAVGIADRVERVSGVVLPDAREACRLSHLECVKRAARAGAETVLILEDDVIFRDYSRAQLAGAIDELRTIPDWEIFYLGGLMTQRPTKFYPRLLRARMVLTHAYAVHRRAFAAVEGAGAPIDVWLEAHMQQTYCTRPLVAWQRDGWSDIEHGWMAKNQWSEGCYNRFAAPYPVYILLQTRRNLGHLLVRLAASLGVRLRFENAWPRIDSR